MYPPNERTDPCNCGHDLWEHATEEDDKGRLLYARECSVCACLGFKRGGGPTE